MLVYKCKCGRSTIRFTIKGRGRCEKHGIFSMQHPKRTCPICAREKGICPDCGASISDRSEDSGTSFKKDYRQ